ncbi:uroporphyrinogen decarboxylase [Microaerobacter geothermalis]|uniref:uroporphyrinogen decarboxylase n=1 Tax=Microaerobacter geothermalis TaxID=674972 RepID=UPI001F3F924A|nr:uroporphyrinogen decarboxylase [Microaerobacter geothermalis]MCF6092472.1 uroporphyrinogen decarboxylase [Microaerobacter geothermalis]
MNDRFLRACRRETVDTTPVWYMRQAGRYQPEYREIRKKYSLIDIVKIPELCVEVTTLPVQQLNVDAAILFSDIMVPLDPIGMPFEIRSGIGPVVDHPIQALADVERLHDLDPNDLSFMTETIKILSRELPVPLIGFSGAPFTLASYMIEGKPSRDYLKTKAMMYSDPKTWFALMNRLEKTIIDYLEIQVNAGAKALQIFDSWAGALSPDDYREYVLPTVQRIFQGISHLDVPKIYFGVGTGELLFDLKQTGADVLGVDWRVPLKEASPRIGNEIAIQGNLDPALLLAPWDVLKQKAMEIIDAGREHSGHVFNLGHGVFPTASVDTLKRLTEFIHEYGQRV